MTFETLNLGNDENPCLIKICSTLKEKKKKKKRSQRSQRVAHWISRSVCMVLWRYAWYWSRDSLTPHRYSCSHGTHQVKVEVYENWMASEDQRRGHQAIKNRVHQTWWWTKNWTNSNSSMMVVQAKKTRMVVPSKIVV